MTVKGYDSRNLIKTGFNEEKMFRPTDDQLRQLQFTLINMLKDIIYVCDKNEIEYTLGGGSVLGAVRHGGFIPWDDDIDLNMSRRDYRKFVSVFHKELSEKYILRSPQKGSNYGMAHTQIEKKGTVYRSYNELSKTDDEAGIKIDIFIAENVADKAVLRKMQGLASLAAGYVLTCRKTYEDFIFIKECFADGTPAKKVLQKKARIGRLFAWISLDSVAHFTDNVYSICKNDNSHFVTFPTGRKHFFGELASREELLETVKMDFGGVQVKIPKGYDRYLTRLYGSRYMELPPKEEQENHPLVALKM